MSEFLLRCLVIWATVSMTTGADLQQCSCTSYYLRRNNTFCPRTYRAPDFSQYGFPGDGLPSYLYNYRPHLLHERSVIHHVDMNKAFVEVGSGQEGMVYRAELRDSRTPVIVKTLKNKNFYQIYHEANVLTYLSDVISVPKFVGLLPTGPLRNNLSIVSEYVKNSSTIGNWFNISQKVSLCQWLDISQQMAVSLRFIHEKQILHNDLHYKNILIGWTFSSPKVYFIDFGDSTFRHGRVVKNFNPYYNKTFQKYLPPEVSHDQSTPASDVYSIGKHLQTIARLKKVKDLDSIADQCIAKDPDSRLMVKDLELKLKHLFDGHCPGYVSRSSFEGEERSDPFASIHRHKSFHHLPLPVLTWKDFSRLENSEFSYFNEAWYRPTGDKVVVLTYNDANFEYIRHCARVNLYLNDTSYVPLFKGVVFTGEELSNLALVFDQDPLENTVTLSDFVSNFHSFSELLRVDVLRVIASALILFNSRHIGSQRLYTEDIFIDFDNGRPHVTFTDFGSMYYSGNLEKEYTGSRSPKQRNSFRFTDIVEQVIPELFHQPSQELGLNISSLIPVDVGMLSDWVFMSF